MKLKVKSDRHLIREAMFNDEPYCELCYRNKSVGIFSTLIGRQYLCLDCVRKYIDVLEKNDYFFANNVEITAEEEIRIKGEEIKFIDYHTGKEIDSLLERN